MHFRIVSYSQRNYSAKYGNEDGVGKKRNTLKYDVLKRVFFWGRLLLAIMRKRTFRKFQSNFIGIHIFFVRDCAKNVCMDGFVHSGLCLRYQIEAQLTKSHIFHPQLIDHWLQHAPLIYYTAQRMTA
jgi:hypothetical protein